MLKTMANRAARSMKGVGQKEEVFVDPATIAMFASIIIEVIKTIKKCRDAKSVQKSSQQPTKFEQAVVKRIVRRKVGWKKYFNEGNTITQSVFKVGAGSTEEEIEELYREV